MFTGNIAIEKVWSISPVSCCYFCTRHNEMKRKDTNRVFVFHQRSNETVKGNDAHRFLMQQQMD